MAQRAIMSGARVNIGTSGTAFSGETDHFKMGRSVCCAAAFDFFNTCTSVADVISRDMYVELVSGFPGNIQQGVYTFAGYCTNTDAGNCQDADAPLGCPILVYCSPNTNFDLKLHLGYLSASLTMLWHGTTGNVCADPNIEGGSSVTPFPGPVTVATNQTEMTDFFCNEAWSNSWHTPAGGGADTYHAKLLL